MLAATMLALVLAEQPLRLEDPGVDHGARAGLYDAEPFACSPDDDFAVCEPDDGEGED